MSNRAYLTITDLLTTAIVGLTLWVVALGAIPWYMGLICSIGMYGTCWMRRLAIRSETDRRLRNR